MDYCTAGLIIQLEAALIFNYLETVVSKSVYKRFNVAILCSKVIAKNVDTFRYADIIS